MGLSWMTWKRARKGARMSPTQWMKMALYLKVGRSKSINADRRMTIKVETSDAAAEKGTCLTLLFILTSKLNIMERPQRVPILLNSKQEEVVVVPEKSIKPLQKSMMPKCQPYN